MAVQVLRGQPGEPLVVLDVHHADLGLSGHTESISPARPATSTRNIPKHAGLRPAASGTGWRAIHADPAYAFEAGDEHCKPACRTVTAVHRRVLCALVVLSPARGHADGIAIVGGSPRAIGRAGAAVVGDDGGGALLINPAAMARRDTLRAELGATMIEDSPEWQSDSTGSPRSVGRAGSRLAPLGAAIGAIGDWVFGIGAMTAAVVARSLPKPSDDPKDSLGAIYDYRYTGISGSYRRDTLAFGVARRLGDSLAFGLALGAARVTLSERRRLWGARARRDMTTLPEADVDISLSATDPLTESAVAGVLYAPAAAPIELGASVGWARTVRLDGTARAFGSPATLVGVHTDSPHAALHVAQPIAVRAGGRYVGDRIVAELAGDLWIAARGSDEVAWQTQGISLDDPGTSQPSSIELRSVTSRLSQRTHYALRTAVDVAIVPGFLWATGGYAYSSAGTPAAKLSPSLGDLGGHTLGLGIEAQASGVTATIGWSRTWTPETAPFGDLRLDSPFLSSDGSVPHGTYGGSVDQVGVLIEAELGGR
jgi:hypothetical protein